MPNLNFVDMYISSMLYGSIIRKLSRNNPKNRDNQNID